MISGEAYKYRMTAAERVLWEKLEVFSFDKNPEAPFTFAHRIAKRNKLEMGKTLRLIEETRKFFFLAVTRGFMVAPSVLVDEVWHTSLLYTKRYWVKLCQEILGQPIHHHPGDGSDEDNVKFAAIYERTLQAYREVFGEPPADIWGHSNPRINWRELLKDAPASGKPVFDVNLFHDSAPRTPRLRDDHRALLETLRKFPLDKDPNVPHNFAHRLAKRNDWPDEYIPGAVDEYWKYITLKIIAGHEIVPSKWIDEVQHQHLMYTHNYWVEFCRDTLGVALHHTPGDGSQDDIKANAALFEQTLDTYDHIFGKPPVAYWGKSNPLLDWRPMVMKLPLGSTAKSKLFDLFPRDSDEAQP